jgi:hypothetical protein
VWLAKQISLQRSCTHTCSKFARDAATGPQKGHCVGAAVMQRHLTKVVVCGCVCVCMNCVYENVLFHASETSQWSGRFPVYAPAEWYLNVILATSILEDDSSSNCER